MEKEKKNVGLLNVAMRLGTFLGIYQIIKFVLFPLVLKYPLLSPLWLIIAIGVPFFMYYMIKHYRDNNITGPFPFIVSWILTLATIFFSVLLSVMVCYLYLRFVDHGAFLDTLSNEIVVMKEMYANLGTTESDTIVSQLDTISDVYSSMTIKDFCKLLGSMSLFWGNLIAVIVALFTAKRIIK